jgi:hypothetical protein
MAVGTDDSTFAEFSLQGAERAPETDHVGDVCAFLVEVVELEDTGIRLAAVRTPLDSEVIGHKCARLTSPTLPRQSDLAPM